MTTHKTPFDVLVVGSGHAGSEAALAAARMGCHTAVVTLRPERSGWMPCNPAIGGIGKGHLTREIDALGGEMAKNIDATGIQFRRLNTRKGPAVQSRRAQADMFAYAERMSNVLQSTDNLTIIKGQAAGLLRRDGEIAGITLDDGSEIASRTVIITTGTFLRGLLYTGPDTREGGRVDEKPSNTLSTALADLGLPMLRLKTGTPPRISAKTIDFSKLEEQPGDDPPLPFSFMTRDLGQLVQVPCHMTYTNEQTHEIISSNIGLSPLYSGKIEGIGPRYCPSVEDKIMRFPDRNRHQVFLEPVARGSDLVYPNGISTCLPHDVQIRMVHSIAGLEHAEIIVDGYAVEYDSVDPRSLHPWLELKDVPNLYLAGQINGTSGYEEAGGQGLIAGINAARKVQGKEPFTVDRATAYIGVMIDDLTTRGVTEPYRMFTSRAEYRLLLREDNADLRLTPMGRDIGLVSDQRWQRFNEKEAATTEMKQAFRSFRVGTNDHDVARHLGMSAPPKNKTPLLMLLNRTDLDYHAIKTLDPAFAHFEEEALEQIVIDARYAGYLERQQEEAALFREGEAILIPEDFDYNNIPGLRQEIQELLTRTRPHSLGQAARIPGVTPASLQLLTMIIHAQANAKDAA
jgi:tRNA uridine 5-carboxymethylaminomethyl modification enzyme